MDNFDNALSAQSDAVEACGTWPEGATEADFGKSGTVRKEGCDSS